MTTLASHERNVTVPLTTQRPIAASADIKRAYIFIQRLELAAAKARFAYENRSDDEDEERGLWARRDFIERALADARARMVAIVARELGL